MIRCDMISQISYSISESENIKKLKTTIYYHIYDTYCWRTIIRIRVQYCVHIHIHTYIQKSSWVHHCATHPKTYMYPVVVFNKDLKSKINDNDKIFLVERWTSTSTSTILLSATCTGCVAYEFYKRYMYIYKRFIYIPVALVSCIQLFMCVHVLCTQHYSYNFGLYLDTCVYTHTHTLMYVHVHIFMYVHVLWHNTDM